MCIQSGDKGGTKRPFYQERPLCCKAFARPSDAYRLTALGVSQSGKKVLASILEVCPLVALLNGRK